MAGTVLADAGFWRSEVYQVWKEKLLDCPGPLDVLLKIGSPFGKIRWARARSAIIRLQDDPTLETKIYFLGLIPMIVELPATYHVTFFDMIFNARFVMDEIEPPRDWYTRNTGSVMDFRREVTLDIAVQQALGEHLVSMPFHCPLARPDYCDDQLPICKTGINSREAIPGRCYVSEAINKLECLSSKDFVARDHWYSCLLMNSERLISLRGKELVRFVAYYGAAVPGLYISDDEGHRILEIVNGKVRYPENGELEASVTSLLCQTRSRAKRRKYKEIMAELEQRARSVATYCSQLGIDHIDDVSTRQLPYDHPMRRLLRDLEVWGSVFSRRLQLKPASKPGKHLRD